MKIKKWHLQDAKNRFSELVRKASEDGPQFVSKHGKDSVVVLSIEDYRKLDRPGNSLVNFLQSSPLNSVELDTRRDKSSSRDVSL
ncbi:type II toxin-antitoxin system Phd/YefM family antitoxin [Natronogracilivirga saccharolytica]|uniref:Antitoxin n=1 Tax=Natronogracilivirga saccharolytica TaxID=2812953 RepID=A0A8J7UVT1_9BACT|nr:type II toxin-antitoxin system Phd/YefM family antitoxin [Natronogracilivirga saccharolytica]MBP3192871.1 type II toxin-antitoxin system Phd/YefM family antitoxin [Natronogracilivirga saccharolytica]